MSSDGTLIVTLYMQNDIKFKLQKLSKQKKCLLFHKLEDIFVFKNFWQMRRCDSFSRVHLSCKLKWEKAEAVK